MGSQQANTKDSNKSSQMQNRLTLDDIAGVWYYDSVRIIVCEKGFAQIFEYRENWVFKETAQIKDETIAFKIDGFVLSKKKGRNEIKELVWRDGENVILWVRDDPFARGADPLALEHPSNMNCNVPPTKDQAPSAEVKATEECADPILPDLILAGLDNSWISDSGTDELMCEEILSVDSTNSPLLVPEYKMDTQGMLGDDNLVQNLLDEMIEKELNLHIPVNWVDEQFFTAI